MASQPAQPPDEQRIKRLARRLIREQTTMTLASARADEPWAAPVYYAWHRAAFFFFSAPDARHIQETLAAGQAAAALFAAADSWQGIRGLQMAGTIAPVPVGVTAATAVVAYLKKFPFTREFFSTPGSYDLEAFSRRFNVKFYRFQPHRMLYMDNAIAFGFRTQVHL